MMKQQIPTEIRHHFVAIMQLDVSNTILCQVAIKGGAHILNYSQKTIFKNCIFLEIVNAIFKKLTDGCKNTFCRL